MNEYNLTKKETNDLLEDLINKNESDQLGEFLDMKINSDERKKYLKRHKRILLTRADEKYLRIEKYENYEFTHCITYEMAIRNENVIKLHKLRDMLFIFRRNKVFATFRRKKSENSIDIESWSSNTIISTNFSYTQRATYCMINSLNLEILQNEYEEKNPIKFFKQISVEEKSNILDWLIEIVDQELDEKYFVIDEETYKMNAISTLELHEHNLKTISNNTYKNDSYKTNNIEQQHYKTSQGKITKNNIFNINKTIPTFSQPLRILDSMDISINLSLPIDDILSFVKLIKEDYDKKNSFKSFFELAEEDLNFSAIDTSHYSKQKWADMFYIYDYFQFYFSLSGKNKINKNPTIHDKKNREDDKTTIAKEISLQLSYYHILGHKCLLDFSKLTYDEYETSLLYKIKDKIEENKEYSKYIKSKEDDEVVKFYMSADHIKIDYYPKMGKFIEGNNPEYKQFVCGKNLKKKSLIQKKDN